MKKIWAVLAISFSALMTSSLSIAAPHFDQDRGYDHPRNFNQGKPGRSTNGKRVMSCRSITAETAIKSITATMTCQNQAATSNGIKSIMTIF